MLALSGMAVVPWPTPAAAQERTPPVVSHLLDHRPVTVPLPARIEALHRERRPSTLLERTLWGAGTGFVFLAASGAVSERSDDWVPAAAYAVGSVAGITLVTSAREGARPFRVLLGTAAVAAVPLFVRLVRSEGPSDLPSTGAIVLGLAFFVGVPLGGGIAHSVGQ